MTRPAMISRLGAAILAGGSLFLISPLPLGAQDKVPEPTPSANDGPAVLSISPLRVELEGDGDGATVLLSNGSTRALSIQSRLFAWAQDAGEDVYAPSGDLTISPSITSIPPGETQVVRVLRKSGASPGEKRFRLVVDQLPDPAFARPGQTQTRIRFTVPVFLDRKAAQPAQLAWRVEKDRLELTNSGGSTARVLDLQVKTRDGRVVPVERNSLRYVLGNSTITWPIGNGCSLGAVHVTAQIDGQVVDGEPASVCG